MNSRKDIVQLLDRLNIAYSTAEHQEIYTVEDGENLNLPHADAIARNLFLCDDKQLHYYLVSLPKTKQLDLKVLRTKLNSRRLTFATEEALAEILALPKGAVTPFGALNDDKCTAMVIIDSAFQNGLIAVPINDNAVTIWLKAEDLKQVLEQHGNKVLWLEL